MQHKRILILTNRVPYPYKDGGNLAMKAMIDGYHVNGWQVCLLSMNTSRHHVNEADVRKEYSYLYKLEIVKVYNDVKVINTLSNYLFSKEPSHSVRFKSRAYEKKLLQVIREFDPRIIQTESIYLSTYIPKIRKATNAKLIARLHNIEHQIWYRLADEIGSTLKRIYLKDLALRINNFERKCWQQYDLLLPITENDNKEVKRLYPSAATYVLPYTISNVFKADADEKWVGYHIGAMDWQPNEEGIRWFIETVWKSIRESVKDFEFYYAGRNMPNELTQIQVDGIHNAGEVNDANAFIADKKILIVPLRSGGGIRVKILEAMAAGKVVISTTIGMQGIEVQPGEHYLPANTAQEFASVIHWCVNNKSEAEVIASKGQERVKSIYSSEVVFKRLSTKIIDELL